MAAPKPGGFKMSLGGLKAKPGLKSALLQKDAKRPRLALGDDEPDDTNKQQEISGWDAAEGGALDASGKTEQKKGPLVIPVLPNRNWRENAQRKQQARGAPPQPEAQNGGAVEEIEEVKVQYGLTIVKKEEPQVALPAESGEAMVIDEKDGLTEEQRLEKKALDALLSGKSADDEHVIPVQTEEEAFHNDLRDAPEAPTLEAYEATPIEGFGAALLRGMGWKDGETIGRNGVVAKPKEIKRRPALLGIGAKEEAAVGIELGAWGSKGKGRGKQAVQTYNPVTLRNKHTGETITEEELKAKLENQDIVQEEKPQKTRSRYDDDEEEDERRREKRREKTSDRDRRRDDDYDSERRRDKDRKDDRRRDRDNDYHHDSDRRRDKRREKDRDDNDFDSDRRRSKREDRDRRTDRESRNRSHSPDDRRDKKRDRDRDRDRYRSRSRDSEDRRDKRRERDRRERSRSRDSDEKRKRRRDRDEGHGGDEREERKRSYRR